METLLQKETNDVSKKPTVLSVERAVVLLKRLSDRRDPVGVRELARETGFGAPTVQKLLNSLASQGLVRQDRDTQSYSLALEVFRLGASVLRQMDVHNIAYPTLERLMRDTEESAYLSLLTQDQLRCVFVAKAECSHLLRWTADLGAWRPLNCTADGKAILACLSDDHVPYLSDQGAFHRSTARSIMDPDALVGEVAEVRRRGFAYSDEEFAEGVRALAAPVLDYAESVRGAVSIAGPKSRMTDDRIEGLGSAVRQAGRAVSSNLGFDAETGFYGG